MKAGKYWVGDLCYILGNNEDWGQICAFMGNANQPREGVFPLNGMEGAIFGTTYGDGTYRDQFGNSYGVDSGTLGLFPASAAAGRFADGGVIHDFPEDFEVSCDNGTMIFGHLRIPTGPKAQGPEPVFSVLIRKANGEERVFGLSVIANCFYRDHQECAGVCVSDPSAVSEFVGGEILPECIDYAYAEGSQSSGEYEDMETGDVLFTWQMLDKDGNPVFYEDIEASVFNYYGMEA